MKRPLSLERGRIVISTQGRDKGRAFLILDRIGEDTVTVADGLVHRLERPKKKKTKHLHVKPIMVNWDEIRPEGGLVQDSDLRRALEANGFTVKRSLCKEG
ncbi:MAG: KOW domain-containing RNA-binding protein [Clostridia bacterium]|nr:KOW domain-containing RNA-binding protein [Clostridia bacterium]